MRLRTLAPLLVLLALAIGCKSAEELYDEGQTLEAQGRYAEAAFRYVDSLEKEDSQRARGRLLEAGSRAMDGYVAAISAALNADDPVGAADAYLDADTLLDAAGGVGVRLPVFATYAEDRRATLDAAIGALQAQGDAACAAADFVNAIPAYDAVARYDPTPAQRAATDATLADSYAGWAEVALVQGQFRAAYTRAEAALRYAPDAPALLGLQAAILDAGSTRLAAFPTEVLGGRATRGLPPDFREALNDRLEDEVWSRPPLFVLATYPPDVRRAIRALSGGDERYGRNGTAAELARMLEADFAVATRLDAFARIEEEREREARTADRRDGGTATYTRVETTLDLSATVAYEVVDARTRRVVCEGEAERSVDTRLRRGEYAGRLSSLDLDRDERRLFDEEALDDNERELEQRLRAALAERIADRVFRCVEREVP